MNQNQRNGVDRRMNGNDYWERISETLYEVRDRVTRMEEKQDIMFRRAEKTEEISMDADKKATEALMLGKDNQKEIDSIRANNRWSWGIVLSGVGTLIIAYITKVLHIN